jgi:L-2-hydroxyglutarate oxidase LhgO
MESNTNNGNEMNAAELGQKALPALRALGMAPTFAEVTVKGCYVTFASEEDRDKASSIVAGLPDTEESASYDADEDGPWAIQFS